MNGHIKLHRQFLKWEWYQDINAKTVFLHCLLNANWEDTKYQGEVIPRGSFIMGRKKFAKEIGLSEQSVRTALKHLKSTNEIAIKSTNKYSIVTVVKYEFYQQDTRKSTKKITNKLTNDQPTTNQQLTTVKEYKEEQEDKEVIKENIKEKFGEFVTMTNAEYETLVSTHGKEFTNQCIEILDNYKGSSGKKYKSDYRAILSWVVDKVQKEQQVMRTQKKSSNPFREIAEEEGLI